MASRPKESRFKVLIRHADRAYFVSFFARLVIAISAHRLAEILNYQFLAATKLSFDAIVPADTSPSLPTVAIIVTGIEI